MVSRANSLVQEGQAQASVKLDAGWPESEEGQVGNVKLEEEVKRRSNEDNLVK